MISRRAFFAFLAWSAVARAQTASGPPRIGILTLRRRDGAAAWLQGFRDAFAELGTSVSVELRFADGDAAKLPVLADELASRGVELIAAADEPSFAAARKQKVPVMAASVPTPIDLAPRQVELLVAVRPKLARLAVLVNPKNSAHRPYFNAIGAAAEAKGVRALGVELEYAEDFEAAFADMRANRIGALVIAPDGLFSQNEVRLGGLARQYRLPSMAPHVSFVNTGCLMSYGDDPGRGFHAIAEEVDRLVKGGPPAADREYRPAQIPLRVNRATAKAIGVRLPPPLAKQAIMVQ